MRRLQRIILLVLVLFPFVFMLGLSLGRDWGYPRLIPATWTLEHWSSLMSGGNGLGSSLILSLGLSFSVAVSATGLSFWGSRLVAYHPRRNLFLRSAYFPYVFAPVILGACLQYFFIISGLYGQLGGVLIAQLFITIPYGLLYFSSFWNTRRKAMEELVYTLGGNTWQAYRKVLLPTARPAILTCFFQLFLISWFEYGLTQLIGVGKVDTLTLQVFQYVTESNIFLAALASVLLILPPVILLWLNKRYLFRINTEYSTP